MYVSLGFTWKKMRMPISTVKQRVGGYYRQLVQMHTDEDFDYCIERRYKFEIDQTLPLSKNRFGMSTYLQRIYSHKFLPKLSKLEVELKPLSK